MSHSNEDALRDLYAIFAKGDLAGFLDGCTDDVTFTVPGRASVSGAYTKSTFMDLINIVMGRSGGTFQEDLIDVFANDEQAILIARLDNLEKGASGAAVQTMNVHLGVEESLGL